MEKFIEKIRRNEIQRVGAICYAIEDGKALMIDRIKEPFKGYLVAPGGKREEGETIFDCVKREMLEETGLAILEPSLKVVTTEVGPDKYNWILFIFMCDKLSGTVRESDEGHLTWVEIENLKNERLAQIDKDILPYLFSDKTYLMHLKYDELKNCTIENVEEIQI